MEVPAYQCPRLARRAQVPRAPLHLLRTERTGVSPVTGSRRYLTGTDVKWFHDYVIPTAEVRFIKGRLKFGDATTPAPFPTMLCIWRGPVHTNRSQEKS